MVRIRNSGLVAVLAFGLLGAGACKKQKTGAKGSADDLALLPVDSDMVLSIDATQLRQSAIWKGTIEKAVDKATANNAELKEIEDACGANPITDVTSLAMGVKGFGKDPDKVVLVVHGLPKSKLTSGCFDKLKTVAAKDGGSMTKDGDVYFSKDNTGKTTVFTFTGNDTLLVTSGKSLGTKAAIEQVAKGNSGLRTSAAFASAFKNVKANQTMWIVLGTSPLSDALSRLGGKPTTTWGSIKVTDGISAEGGARFASANAAKLVADKLNHLPQLGMAKMFVDTLAIKADGSVIEASAMMSKAKIAAVKQAHIIPGLQ